MRWPEQNADTVWGRAIINRQQKMRVAEQVALQLKDNDVIGVGSGSTSFLTLKALANRRDKEGLHFRAIATSIEMELVCVSFAIPVVSLLNERPDWSFDGADEVDAKDNLIKGRGGAMLREKMLMSACKRVYIVVDPTKRVRRLGQNFPVPIEVIPEALRLVEQNLAKIKAIEHITLRQAKAKDGPVITETGNLIVDVKFGAIDNGMERRLKSIVGVVESGLFIGYKPTVIIG